MWRGLTQTEIFLQRQGNKQDQLLVNFVKLTSYQTGKPTFFRENGKDSPEIDIIFSRCIPSTVVTPTIVEEKCSLKSKKISNDQELIQSDPTSCPQNQKGNN